MLKKKNIKKKEEEEKNVLYLFLKNREKFFWWINQTISVILRVSRTVVDKKLFITLSHSYLYSFFSQ